VELTSRWKNPKLGKTFDDSKHFKCDCEGNCGWKFVFISGRNSGRRSASILKGGRAGFEGMTIGIVWQLNAFWFCSDAILLKIWSSCNYPTHLMCSIYSSQNSESREKFSMKVSSMNGLSM
jgi:hypothetical protein